MASLAHMLASLASDDNETEATDNRLSEAIADDLRNKCALYTADRGFKVGDLVETIPGLGIYKFPKAGHPAVVIETIDTRGVDEAHARNEFFSPLTIRIAVLDSDGDFSAFAVDAGRFRLWTGAA